MTMSYVLQVSRRRYVMFGVTEHQVGMALQFGLAGGIALAANYRGYHFERMDEHGRVTCGVLSDHVKHGVRQATIVDCRHDKHRTSLTQDDPAG